MTDRVATDPSGDQRARVADILVARSNHKGYVKDCDIALIARLTGITSHDVAKHLWGMQKQGLVGFSTKHEGGKTVPYRFRVRGDLLDAARRDTLSEPTERLSPALEPDAGIQAPQATGEPVPALLVAASIPMSQETLDDADTMMDARPPAFTAEAYPEIFALIERESRREIIEEAARALEQAGLDDLAVQALESIPPITPLEIEIRALVRVYWRKEWEHPGASLREMLASVKEAVDAD